MRYVDGYVLPVPKKNVQAYRRMAEKASKIWREHGTLEYRECVATISRSSDALRLQADGHGGFKILVEA